MLWASYFSAFLLGFRSFGPVTALTTHQPTQTNRALGLAGMASQVDCKNLWRSDDFQERVEKMCSTLAEKKGRLIVITDFDRYQLLLFFENHGTQTSSRTLSAYTGADGMSCDECHDIVFRHCCPDDRWKKDVDNLWSETDVAFEG